MSDKHKVRIRWGEESTQREVYEDEKDAAEYEFDTEAELAAFLKGVDEAVGYMECSAVDEEGNEI